MSQPTLTAQKEVTTVIWTAVASTGAVDEDSLNDYAFNLASFSYNAGSGSQKPITAYYNVVNTYRAGPDQDPNQPPWHTLELGATAPGSGRVTATISMVENCTGNVRDLCMVTIEQADKAECRHCVFNEQVDFGKFLYFVRVEVSRRDPRSQPSAHTLRIF
jgi:hypothetical protein